VLANADTGLAAPDVFYFGNAIGEAGNSPADARVTATDMLMARNNPRSFTDPAPINLVCDYNRDARVNATDVLIARNNQTNAANALRLIRVPSEEPKKAAAKQLPDRRAAPAKFAWLSEYGQSSLNAPIVRAARPLRADLSMGGYADP
jgi:hypothetical protein